MQSSQFLGLRKLGSLHPSCLSLTEYKHGQRSRLKEPSGQRMLLFFFKQEALSELMLCAPVFIYTSSSLTLLGPPTLWFIDLTVATCHVQCILRSLCQFFFTRKRTYAAEGYWARKALILRETNKQTNKQTNKNK